MLTFNPRVVVATVCAAAIPVFPGLSDDMSSTNAPTISVVTPADFVWDAGLINLKEMRLGHVAQTNSQNPEVQKFGKEMVRDHTRLFNYLVKIAGAEGLQLPDTNTFYMTVTAPEEKEATELLPETPQQRLLDAQLDVQNLASLTGPDFDQAYADAMVKGHEKAVGVFENAASTLQDKPLKKYAEKGLRIIRHHLEMARDLQSKVMPAMQNTNAPASSGGSMNGMNGMSPP